MFNFNEQWFEKHQERLLKIANSKWLRYFVGANRLPKDIKSKKFDKITPNSIHSEGTGYFYPRPRFAEALAYNLSPFCYFQELRSKRMVWRFSPAGLAYLLLFGLVGKFAGLPIAFMGTTTAFYPIDGTTVDGMAWRGVSTESWATIRGSAGTNHDDTSASGLTYCGIQCSTTTNQFATLVRSYTLFLTGNTIASTDIVSSATYGVYGSAKDSARGGNIQLDKCTPASNTALANGDYDNAKHSFVSQSDTSLAASAWSTTGYNILTLNATGLGNIGKGAGAITYLGLKTSYDMSDTAPTWASAQWTYVQGYTSKETGDTKDPYLSVTYAPPVSPTVTTQAVTDQASTSGTGNGNITATGGANATRRGFAYVSDSFKSLETNLEVYLKCDESTGTNANDSTANNRDGTLLSGTAFNSGGKINYGIKIDSGQNKNFYIADAAGLEMANGTISLWFKPTATMDSTTGYQYLFVKGNIYIGLYKQTGEGRLTFSHYAGTNRLAYTSQTSWTGGTWYHAVVTWGASGGTIYINGSVDGTNASTDAYTNTTDNWVFGNPNAADTVFDGIIDEVAFWSRQLSSTEVTALYNSGNAIQYHKDPTISDSIVYDDGDFGTGAFTKTIG